MSVCSCLRHFQMKWLVCASESHWRGWPLHRTTHSNLSNTRFGKNTSPLCKSLSIDHVSLRSSFSLGVYQTWQGGHQATLLLPRSSSTLHITDPSSPSFPVLPCSPPFFSHTGQGAVLIRALVDYRDIWAISYSCFIYVALEEFSTDRRSNTEWLFQDIFLKKS